MGAPPELPWREDPSWEDLVRLSWAVESPFQGSVTLWPRLATDAADDMGLWRAEYRRDDDGVSGQAVTYVLERGQLHKN